MRLFKTRRSQIPGSRFDPTDQELIRILRRKSCSYITVLPVYEKEPWLLQHVRHFRSVKNQWFYFVRRTKPPGIKKEDSKKTSRTVAGFTWKSNTTTSIPDANGVSTIGYKKSLTFLVDNKSSGWVMHEFTLDRQEFQEVVLCRICFNPGNDNDKAKYAPRLKPIVIGQPQPQTPREEAVKEEIPEKIHQGVEQQQNLWTRSCPSDVVSYQTAQQHQQLMNGGRERYQDFGSFGQFTEGQQYYQNTPENQDFGSYAQYWGGALAQNHLTSVTIETRQGMEQQQKQWTRSCPSDVVSYQTAQQHQLMNGGREQYQDFGSFGQFIEGQQYYQHIPENQDFGSYAQYWGGALAQNNLPLVTIETRQGMDQQQKQWTRSCPSDVVSYQTAQQHQQLMNGGMEQYPDFSSYGKFVGAQPDFGSYAQKHQGIEPQQHDNSLAYQGVEYQEFGSLTQFSGGDLTQNHISVVPMETKKDIEPQQQDNSRFGHNVVVENETTEPPNLTQEQNQPPRELDETDEFVNWEWPLELEDMANFGNKEWRKLLGENTPEEEAELKADIGNCKTTASLINYFIPI